MRILREKVSGVSYAPTGDGLDLPVIDLTHPAFGPEATPEELPQRLAAFKERQTREEKMPRWLRRLLLRFLFRRSRIGRGLWSASGTYLDGVSTYLLKLRPEHFAPGIDRAIAASFPALAMRLRLQDTARLLADGLAAVPALPADRPIFLLNIGGGPAVDSLNALIILRREHPARIENRPIDVQVLDFQPEGPAFGVRALAALQSEGMALHGLSVRFRHTAYDWSKPAALGPVLAEAAAAGAAIAISSEGALFEYGSDEEIVANLQAMRTPTPPDAFIVGSVTRDEPFVRRMHAASGVKVRPRGLEVFRNLATRGGWQLDRVREGPLSDQVSLTKR